jgi:uncharacterized protein (DUF2164 family)
MSIELTPEDTTRAIASLRRYCDEVLDQEVGELKARLFLEYILKEIGPSVYNGAIADAQRYFRDRVGDLDGACSQQEFGYWPRSTARRSP